MFFFSLFLSQKKKRKKNHSPNTMLQGLILPPENSTHWNAAGLVSLSVTAHLDSSSGVALPASASAPAPSAAPVAVRSRSRSAGLRGQNLEGFFFLFLPAFLAKTLAAAALATSTALAASTGGRSAPATPAASAAKGSERRGSAGGRSS